MARSFEPSHGTLLERVDVLPTNFVLASDETRQLSATAVYAGGVELDVTSSVEWSTDDELLVTVDGAGLVTGVAAGSTTVRATLGASVGGASVIVSGGASSSDEWFFSLAGR